jgi:hypothetical protein
MKNRIESLEGELTPLKQLRLDLKTKRLVIKRHGRSKRRKFPPVLFPRYLQYTAETILLILGFTAKAIKAKIFCKSELR